jgi:outer membrane protein OmpA-like peptidoglycan-associated protein
MQSRRSRTARLLRLIIIGFTGAVATLAGGAALADEPVLGGGLSAAIPISKFKTPADLGGGFDIYGGYRFSLLEHVDLSLLGGPEFNFFPNDGGGGDDAITLLGLTAGPRLSIGEDGTEVFIDGRGGYAWDLSGPIDDDGAAWSLGGGIAFQLVHGTALTLFGRYNESEMRARPGSDSNLRFVNAGIGIQHRFLAPEPMAQAEAPPPPSPAPPMKQKIILRGVNFDFDKADIRADARPVLDEAARTLTRAGTVSVAVAGHTDSVGSDAYNQNLSIRRANAVADYLATRGVSRNRMRIDGYGESRPVASNDTDDGRAQNRRVELSVIP